MLAITVTICLLAASASASQVQANPMEKVNELLGVLDKEIMHEGQDDSMGYREYTAHYQKEARLTEAVIKENAEKIERLEADLKEADAFREGKSKDLVNLADQIAHDDMELNSGRKLRNKELLEFETNEATFDESIDQLERSLEVMKKKKPAAASASAASASLITVAEKLKRTLTHGFDVSLNPTQRSTLNSFVRTAYVLGDFGSRRELGAPSFLQQNDPYGDFTSSAGGIVGTLEELHDKVQKERDAAIQGEVKQKQLFKEWQSGIVEALENGKKSLVEIKSSVAQSQQQSSQNEAMLMQSKQIYKSETEHMEHVTVEYRQRTQAYKDRLAKRSDEAIAVHEARRILSSDIAKAYIKHQTIGSSAASLLQHVLRKNAVWRKKSVWQKGLRKGSTHGLSLLALRSTVRKSSMTADPFGKVKSMLKDMLAKLMDNQAQESEHAAWCDKEMGKTTKEMGRKKADVGKMKNRLEALSADLIETTDDLSEVNKDLKDMTASMAEAVSLRTAEHRNATRAIEQYKSGAALLKKGCKVLKSYYQNEAKRDHKSYAADDSNELKQRKGLGSGIVALLEIAITDFENQYAEAKVAEDGAAADFKSLQADTRIRNAVFQKDLEWKTRTKVKLEYDESMMKNDLKSYKKELSAIDSYMDKLQASCIVQGPSYAERKAKREAELQSLKEALEAIQSRGAL